MSFDYESLSAIAKKTTLPAMFVDLDTFDHNVDRLKSIAERHGKKLRPATKSLRVPELIQRLMERGAPIFQGLMCYSCQEAEFLASMGFDDLLVAYPTVQQSDIEAAARLSNAGKTVILMIDEFEHIEILSNIWSGLAAKAPLRVCIDFDMSYRPFGDFLHLGVRRSPIRTIKQFSDLVELITKNDQLTLDGVMGYEAQIAGLPDQNPIQAWQNPFKALIKSLSTKDVRKKRKNVSEVLKAKNIELRFFNGGGTGCLESTAEESWLTEVTAGSGFLQSQLFDYYNANRNQPAFCFGLQVTRIPEKNTATCQSGGFIASGETSADKSPTPFLPAGLKTFSSEGFGEVQTPLRLRTEHRIKPGDAIFFRPAKAGEIAERFNEYQLIQNGNFIKETKTYRGLGKAFY